MARIQQNRSGTRKKRVPMAALELKLAIQDSLTLRGFPPTRWGECLTRRPAPLKSSSN
jgi:hypothetical protein